MAVRDFTETPRSAGAVVAVFGLLLAAVHVAHGLGELPENLLAVAAGSALPLVVALLIVAGGYSVATYDWNGVSPWRAVAWCFGATVVVAALSLLLVQYQIAEGVPMNHSVFVPVMFGTYGAALGLLLARYDADVRSAQEALRRKNQRLDEFASIVSHDLRNPLNVADGYAERAIATGDLDHLERVRAAHGRMGTILDDMLTLARTGEEALTPTDLDLATVAGEAWTTVATGEATLEVGETRALEADPGRLRALFENLYRNAVEHSDGPVTVTVSATDWGFVVEDDGTGIDPAERERVFEAGYTTGGGSGLGLPIVRAAADAHGWRYSLTESDGGGARFEFVVDGERPRGSGNYSDG